MILLRLLKPQGIAGLALALALAVLLAIQKGETRHWKKQSGQFEQLYAQQRSALAATVANSRAAAAAARASDAANAARVVAAQRAINERTSDDFEARIAAARAAARAGDQRLRDADSGSPTDPRARRAAPMPGLSAAPRAIAQGPGQGRLSAADALLATEQAIQLDELIKWVKRQAALDPNAARPAD
jgi:hypothetical protein